MIILILIVEVIILLVFCCHDSQTKSNQWGDNPKRREEIELSQIYEENDSKPDVVICPYCGAKIPQGQCFCNYCGPGSKLICG